MNRCTRGTACYAADTTQQGGDTTRVGAACDRPLCDVCTAAVARALDDTPQLYVRVRLKTLDRDVTGPGEQVTISRGSPMPLHGRALHLGEDLAELLTRAENDVRTVARLTPAVRDGRREGRRIVDACRLLAAHLTAWITVDVAQPMALLEWRATARRLPGVDATGPKAVRRFDEPCMYCGVKAVTYRSGDDLVYCQACAASWDRDAYTIRAAAFADHLKRIGAAS